MAVSRAPLRARSTLVDRVAMQIGAAAAALGADAFGQHAHHGVEILARRDCDTDRRGARARTARPRRIRARPLRRRSAARARRADARGCAGGRARRAARNRAARRSRPARRGSPGRCGPSGTPSHRVVGAADALQEHRDAARRAELAHQLDVADVDAELERGGGHHDLELAGLEALLGVEAGFLGERCRGARRPFCSPSRSARWRETRSTMRRVFAKTSVV